MLLAAVVLGTIGLLDYLTPPDVDFELFYLVPVVLVGWFAGWRSAVVFALIAIAVEFAVDTSLRRPTPGAAWWNEVSRTTILMLAGFAVDRLHRERERLRRTNAERDTLIRLLEREFPRPLRGLDWYGRTFEETLSGRLNTNERRHLAALRHHIKQIAFLAGDLLAIGNLHAGRVSFDLSPLDLRQIAVEAAGESEDRARVVIGPGIDTVTVRGHHDALRHALASVISHALALTPSEPVTVLVHPSDRNGVIEIDCSGLLSDADLELARLLVDGIGGRLALALGASGTTSIVTVWLPRFAADSSLSASASA